MFTSAASAPGLAASAPAICDDVLDRNRRALAEVQPDLVVPPLPPGYVATAGRDGSRTLRTPDGKWYRQCSVPRATAAAMLESLTGEASVALLLHPPFPAAIRATLDRIAPEHALIALLDDPDELPQFLSCEDFSADFHEHRLLLACSTGHLAELLASHDGLPTPGLFVRLSTLHDSVCRQLIDDCQRIFQAEHDRRASLAAGLAGESKRRSEPVRRSISRVVLSFPRRFHPHNPPADLLAEDLSTRFALTPWHPDDPLQTSPLHLLKLAGQSDVLLLLDCFRDDIQNILPAEVHVVTLATGPRICPPRSDTDALVLTHRSLLQPARSAGWPEHRTTLATLPVPPAPPPARSGSPLLLLADTRPVSLPPAIEEFSSHRLLWERAFAELTDDPLLLGHTPETYLTRLRSEMGISEHGFPIRTFITELAIPLWQQRLVLALLEAGLPVCVAGRGWDKLSINATVMPRPTSRAQLTSLLGESSALLPPEPLAPTFAHPLADLGRALLQPRRGLPDFIARAARAVASPPHPGAPGSLPVFDAELLLNVLRNHG
jgi:hypothetical protein